MMRGRSRLADPSKRLASQASQSLRVEIGGQGVVAGYWMKIPRDVAVIYVLHGHGRIVGSVAPEKSLRGCGCRDCSSSCGWKETNLLGGGTEFCGRWSVESVWL
uniref:Uncharacterized protein n=1 Tax=Romanomermis culicivorax TaxID=13658 RepID=A0A915I2R3_ROMCU